MLRDARRIEKKRAYVIAGKNVVHRVDFILDSYIQLIDSERESPFSNSRESQEKATPFLCSRKKKFEF